MSDSTVQVADHDGVDIVSFEDHAILDTLAIKRISRQLYDLVEGSRGHPVLIDFQNVRFLSSQALGVLLTLRRKADTRGVRVGFMGLRPELLRIFQLTKLDTMFRFFDSREAALAELRSKPTAS